MNDAASTNGSLSASTRRTSLLGAPVDALTLQECLVAVDGAVVGRRQLVHTAVNASKVVRIQRDAALADALWAADISTADGQPVVWAARVLGQPIPERVAGIDLMEHLLSLATQREYRVYLLGARPEVVEDAALVIRKRHPGILISGYRDGYFRPDEDEAVATAVAEAAPDLLFVALETPRKELFLAQQRDRLRVPFAMGVGGAFDVLAGRRRRAPRWAQRVGLEWLFRLVQDPRRLGSRYAASNVQFVALVLRELLRRGARWATVR